MKKQNPKGVLFDTFFKLNINYKHTHNYKHKHTN